MALAGISLGSNLGEREKKLRLGLELLQIEGLKIDRQSTVIETEPVGYQSTNRFLNQCVLVQTHLPAEELLLLLLRIEQKAGRVRNEGQISDRYLDLDLLFLEDRVVQTPTLCLPHPRLQERYFVLAPLREILPGWIHPVLGLSVEQMFEKLMHSNTVPY
mgnify:CR=1 FL=1